MPRYLNRSDDLHVDVRLRYIRQAQHARPRLPHNLRQLGAVGVFVPKPPPGSQQTVVHGWITKASTTGDHLQYLQREKGRDGTNAVLFGPQGASVDPKAFARRAQQDTHQFRMSISLDREHPYFARQPYIEALMRQVEKDVGRPLDWVAATHHDTPHTHTHVVLRGRDLDGKSLYLKMDYLTHGLRYRADRLATWFLGPTQEYQVHRTQTQARQQQAGAMLRGPEQQRGQEMGL